MFLFPAGVSKFTVLTDHKPFTWYLFQTSPGHPKSEATSHSWKIDRLQLWIEVDWGQTHLIADALSRAPVFNGFPDDASQDICSSLRVEFDPVIECAKTDSFYQDLIQLWQSGRTASEPKFSSYAGIWHRVSLHGTYFSLIHTVLLFPLLIDPSYSNYYTFLIRGTIKQSQNASTKFFGLEWIMTLN